MRVSQGNSREAQVRWSFLTQSGLLFAPCLVGKSSETNLMFIHRKAQNSCLKMTVMDIHLKSNTLIKRNEAEFREFLKIKFSLAKNEIFVSRQIQLI